jgi:tetratricopeptide (TPR) repeat protein
MTEENNSGSQDDLNNEATAQDQSQSPDAGGELHRVMFGVQQEEIVKRLEGSSPAELPGVMPAGNPDTTLAHWQGRSEEITQLTQWLEDKNIALIGIEGIGGIGKSMLAAKIYKEIGSFSKRCWVDVSCGLGFGDLACQVLGEFGDQSQKKESQLIEALINRLKSESYLLIIDNLESLLQPDQQWDSQFYSEFFTVWAEYGDNSKILIITRERPQQPISSIQWLSLKGLKIEAGVKLLTALGIRGNLEAFIKLVDGHPLLLRLVADLLTAEFPEDPSLERLGEIGLGNLQQILTDTNLVNQHHRGNVAMVLVLDASFARLNNLQKQLLLNLSVYRGGFHQVTAANLLSEISENDIERELKTLVNRSWLLEKPNCQKWFNFQSVVLEYLRCQAGDKTELYQQAISFYLLHVKQKPWHSVVDIQEYLEIFYHQYQLQQYDAAFDVFKTVNDFLTLNGYYMIQVELCRQLIGAWEITGERKNWNYHATITRLGFAYQYLEQYQQALHFYQQSLQIAQENSDRPSEVDTLGYIGLIYQYLGQYQQAIEYHQQSLQIAREIGNRREEGRALGYIGDAYQSWGQYQYSLHFYLQLLPIVREIGDRLEEGNTIGYIGVAYQSLGQYQQAIEFHQQWLNIAREIGDRLGEVRALGYIGNAYHSLGQYQQSLEFHQQRLNIARDSNNRLGEGRALGCIGTAYQSLRQYQQAIESHQQWLNIAREIGDRVDQASALGHIGNCYQNMEQYQQAIDFYQQWLNIAREIGDRVDQASALGCIGNCYQNMEQYQQAIDFYQQWLNIAREIGNRVDQGSALGNIGNSYQSWAKYQQAIEFHQQWLNIARETGDRFGTCKALGKIGLAYQSLEQYQQAISFHQQSLQIAREIGDRFAEGSVLKQIGIAYQSWGKYQQAIEFHQQSLQIAQEIGDQLMTADNWFYLGSALEKVNRESDAIGAYRHAAQLYQTMKLDAQVQDCKNAIDGLSPEDRPVDPPPSSWLNHLCNSIKGLWRSICIRLRS